MKGNSVKKAAPARRSGHEAFRSVDEWKSSLMTLPDSNFFELLRSVFGNFKTPFNKQRLLDSLFVFLSRNEIRETIAAYINEKDHKIISAVALLNEPVPGDMENFFAGEFSGAEIHALIINLEERLILYRINIEGVLYLTLNPVLEQVLTPFITDTRLLFPSFSKEGGFPAEQSPAHGSAPGSAHTLPAVCFPDGRIMAAFFSFISIEDELFKTEGGIRKKVMDEGKKIFPALDLELAVRTLLLLGLFYNEDHCLIPSRDKIEDFSELSAGDRLAYWTSGVYLAMRESVKDNNVPETPDSRGAGGEPQSARNDTAPDSLNDEFSGSGIYSRTRMRWIAVFIRRLMGNIEPEKLYPEITLRRFWELLKRQDEETWNSFFFDNRIELSFDSLLEAMEKTGVLENAGSCRKAGPGLLAATKNNSAGEAGKPVIAMDTAFSVILYPEISFADALELAKFCSLKKNTEAESSRRKDSGSGGAAKTAICFELTRESVIRGFNQGISAETMAEFLNRLSHNRLDANLGWTLHEWEKRYAEVSLHEGIILTLAEDSRYLADVKPVASLIQRTLAPGVYLLSSGERQEAVRALKKAGVDIVAQPPSGVLAASSFTSARMQNTFPRVGLKSTITGVQESTASPKESSKSLRDSSESLRDSGAIQEKFYQILEKMRLTKQERDELAARIDRRLVLSETQLDKNSLRYEKLEARGIDYAGKLAIAKQAIDSGSMVEISWPGPNGTVNRTVGFVQVLEKKEGENILILNSFNREARNNIRTPGNTIRIPGNTIRIPLGKISLLRRIKRSIFGE